VFSKNYILNLAIRGISKKWQALFGGKKKNAKRRISVPSKESKKLSA
jgi:hypothetical protein